MPGRLRVGTMGVMLAALLLLPACDLITGPDRPKRIERLPRALTVGEQEVIARSNEFAFDLLREVYRRAEQPNVFISPFSASMVLGMLLNGADTETYQAIRATLRLDGLTQEEINRSYRDLTSMLLGLDRQVELRIANSAWARQQFPLHQSFSDAVSTWFGAEARSLDFASPAALTTINDWAATHTNNRIRKVLDRIDADEVLFLLNAVYFKADWTERFDPARTGPAPFTLEDGQVVQVDRMSGRVRGGVAWAQLPPTSSAPQPRTVVLGELPYGGQAYVLTVVVPIDRGMRLTDLIDALDAATWEEWLHGLPVVDYGRMKEPLHVELPKLELTWGDTLNQALAALGMGVAFDPYRADFGRLSPARTFLNFVKQDTYLRMDEKGTEAAAVTTSSSGPVSAPPMLNVNRPYLFVIRERLSGTILFMGAIRDPRSRG
jgi:serine protease inhibitor